jgi:hypothetical protein
MGFTEDSDVTLNLYDRDGDPRAGFGLYADGDPALQLADKKGNLRAALGTASMEDPSSGASETRPVSSLVLFDGEGRAIWHAP